MAIGRTGRLAVGIGAAALLLLAGGWALAWCWAAGETAQTLDDWMARETRIGRHWSCPGRAVSGFPATIVVRCPTVGFDGEIAERHFSGHLGGFRAEASLLHPRSLLTSLQSPFALNAADGGGALQLSWTRLDIDLVGVPTGVAQASVEAEAVTLTSDMVDGGQLEGAAGRVIAQLSRRTDRPDNAYDVHLRLEGGRIPPLDLLLGAPAPTFAAFDGTLNQIDFAATGSAAQRMETWRQAGGRLDVASVRIAHGDANVGGAGSLTLDGAHRAEGRLDARFGGLEPVLRRFGVDPGLVAATGLLGSLLGGRNAGKADDGGGLRLPVTFAGGRVAVGPVRTAIPLPPLY